MKKYLILMGSLFIVLTALVACAQTNAATPPLPMTATSDAAAYWGKVAAAKQAYTAGRFDEAASLAREAAGLNPADNAAWNLLEEAAVASAGDDYLKNLPAGRYRIKPLNFVANQVNGTKYFILDVREPDEFAAGHIEGAINIPLRQLGDNISRLPENKSAPMVVYCHTQKRATHVLVVLREMGYTNIYNLEGGIVGYQDWIDNNPLPTPGPTPTFEPEGPSC